jgi:hypothetical protein
VAGSGIGAAASPEGVGCGRCRCDLFISPSGTAAPTGPTGDTWRGLTCSRAGQAGRAGAWCRKNSAGTGRCAVASTRKTAGATGRRGAIAGAGSSVTAPGTPRLP